MLRAMRHLLRHTFLVLLLATGAGCAAEAAEAAAPADTTEWRPIRVKDCPEVPRKALIAESEKLAAGEEIGGFELAQTLAAAPELKVKAEFTAGGKRHTLIAKGDGTIESAKVVAVTPGSREPAGAKVADPAVPGSGAK